MNGIRPEALGWTRRHVLGAGGAAAAIAAAPEAWAQSQSQTPSRGKLLTIASPATPASLDVEASLSQGTVDTLGAFYDHLIQFNTVPDPDNPDALREDIHARPELPGGYNLRGKLAESWECSPDGKRVRFTLRQGVLSQHGNALTAADVKYSFDRKFALQGEGGFTTAAMGLSSRDQVRVEGTHTVSFNLDKPNPILIIVCGHLSNPIFDAKKCQEMATPDDPWARRFLDTDVAGFGPYQLKQLARGRQLVAEARSDYHGTKPYFETVILREVPTSAARMALLKEGAVDIAQALTPTEMTALRGDARSTVSSFDSSLMMWVQLNTRYRPLDNPMVRRALNHAFPHQAVHDTVMQGFGKKPTGVMPPCYPGATAEYWRYDTDLAQARALLTRSGFPNGFSSSMAYNAGNPIEEPIALMYQAALKDIGVHLTLKKLPASSYLESLTRRHEAMIVYLDAPWTPDPGFLLNRYLKASSAGNFSNYFSADADRHITASLSSLVRAERMAAVRKAQEVVMGDAPWVFVSNPGFHVAHARDLKGLTYYTSNRLNFQDYARG